MRCEQARQLFDAYLDGELSTALATELGAHRIKCASCRRELAILEVTGHIIRSDSAAAGALTGDFTERLMQCVESPRQRRLAMLRRSLLVGGPLAAAAVILLAFAGFFDGRGKSKVAGVSEVNPHVQAPPAAVPQSAPASDRELEDWLNNAKRSMDSARRSGESLQSVLDSTLTDVLEAIEDGDQPAADPDGQPVPKAAESPDAGDGAD